MPDINSFRQAMKNQGYSDVYIEKYIEQKTGQKASQVPEKGMLRKTGETIATSSVVPIITALLGGTAGSVIPGAGNVAGGAVGYAGGRALQESLQSLLGIQDQTGLEAVADVGRGTAMEALGGKLGNMAAPVLSKVAGTVARPLGKKVFNWGISQPAKIAEKQFVKDATGAGFDFGEEMIERGVKGTAKSMYQTAQQGKQSAWEAVQEILKQNADDAVRGVTDINPIGASSGIKPGSVFNVTENFKNPLINELKKAPPGQVKDFGKEFANIWSEINIQYGDDLTLAELVDLNTKLNSKTFTQAGTQTTSDAAKTKAYKAMSQQIQSFISQEYPELKTMLNEYGLYKDFGRIATNTGKKQGKPPQNILQLLNLPFKALTNPYVTTNAGSSIYNIPTGLEKYLTPTIQAGVAANSSAYPKE
jgi:hypothetical protein